MPGFFILRRSKIPSRSLHTPAARGAQQETRRSQSTDKNHDPKQVIVRGLTDRYKGRETDGSLETHVGRN